MHKRFAIHGSLPDWGSFIKKIKDRLWTLISISVLKILTWNLVCMQSKPSAIKYCTVFVVRPEMTKYGPDMIHGGSADQAEMAKNHKMLIISEMGGPRVKTTLFSDSPPSTSVINGCSLSTRSVKSPIIAHFDFPPLSRCLSFNNYFVFCEFFLWVSNPNMHPPKTCENHKKTFTVASIR